MESGDLSFAERLRRRRKKLGLSGREVATEVGVSYRTYQRWESPHADEGREDSYLRYLPALARILQTTPEALTGGEAVEADAADANLRLAALESEVAQMRDRLDGLSTLLLNPAAAREAARQLAREVDGPRSPAE